MPKNTSEDIVRKVQKLLKVADKKYNNFVGEMETAVALVHRLLRHHGLSMADVMTEEEAKENASSLEVSEVEGAVFKCSKVPKWMTILISAVNQMTDTRTVIRNFVPEGRPYGSITILFIGTKNDIKVANDLYHYLRNAVTKLSTKHQREVKGKFQQWRSFAEGCVCKIMQRVLKLKGKWNPQDGEKSPWDVENFECEDEDDFECDLSNFFEGEDLEKEFSDETHKKYEIMIAGKDQAIHNYIEEMELEEESLSTSANLDHKSFEKGEIAGENINLTVHKSLGKDHEN